ncbi:MFS transporter [Shouchella sp. JSM 1781072]|uniref:MFS transporter n=1 Tax=Bacillaceae TaxID=186817 RepID=UPI000C085FE4|nr:MULTISPECIES: MFS transporter [Bacillaceae]UTR05893.1 MFS transporter [Alkalihalobacillus sp. LMS6]
MNVLKKEKKYSFLFWSLFFIEIGHRFAQVASFALVFHLTGSGFALGILLSLQVLPTILIAPISGMLADRYHKMKLLYWSSMIRSPFALLPLVAVYFDEVMWLYISTLLIAIGNAIYKPVRYAAIPDLVRRKNLLNVNGMEQNLVGYTLVIGSLIGGILAFWLETSVLFAIHTGCLLVSALVLKPILHTKTDRQRPLAKDDFSFFHTIRWFTRIRALQVFFLIMLLMPLANGIDNVIMNMIALDEFEQGELGVGLMYAALGLGFVLSSKVTKWLRSYLSIGVMMIALEGIGHLLLSQSSFFFQAILLAISITFVGGISNICFDTVVMKILPPSKRGVLSGTLSMVQTSAIGLAMVAGGFLSEHFTAFQLSFVIGLVYVGFSLFFFVLVYGLNIKTSMRQLRGMEQSHKR